jgi:hypothetical protein
VPNKKTPPAKPVKVPGKRGGHKPNLPPELALVTRGMRARPDEWARFFAIVELTEPGPRARSSERVVFARMIAREADAIDPGLADKFERIRKKKLAEIVASNAARVK